MKEDDPNFASVIASYERAKEAYARAEKRVEEIRKQLAQDCSHPKAYQREFEWEHDNGYGRQTRHTGVRCVICRAEKRYSRFISPEEMGR